MKHCVNASNSGAVPACSCTAQPPRWTQCGYPKPLSLVPGLVRSEST